MIPTSQTTIRDYAEAFARARACVVTLSADVRPGLMVIDPSVIVVHPEAHTYTLAMNAGRQFARVR